MPRQVTSRTGLPQILISQVGGSSGSQCQQEASFVTRKAVSKLTFRWANFDPANIDLWRTDLGNPTSDGIHPEPILHDALVSQLQPQLATITGIWYK